MKRLAVIAIALLTILCAARPAVANDPPQALVQSLADEVVVLLNNPSLKRDGRLEGLRNLFTKYMDLPFVGRFVLGRHWRPLDDGKRFAYTKAFEDYVVNIYAKRLESYSGETIHVLGSRSVNDRDTLVASEIRRASGPPVALEWRVRDRGGEPKVIDVTVEGVSMAISQRDEFATFLQNASIDALIARLKQDSAG